MPPSRRWIKNNSALSISLGVLTSLSIYLLLIASKPEPLAKFFLERGVIQPIILSVAMVVVYYCMFRFQKIKREVKSASKNWLLDDLQFTTQRLKNIGNTLKLLNQSKSIVANRQIRILHFFMESDSRNVARELQKDDAEASQTDIENGYAVVRTMIWMMPMLGFLGTVLGISVSISGFSGLLVGLSNLTTVKAGLGRVTSGLSTAFDTTLLGIVCAITCMLIASICEKWEYELSQKINANVTDGLLHKLAGHN